MIDMTTIQGPWPEPDDPDLPEWADRWATGTCPRCNSRLVVVAVWPPAYGETTVCVHPACHGGWPA